MKICVAGSQPSQLWPDTPVAAPHNSHKSKIVVQNPDLATIHLIRSLQVDFEKVCKDLWTFFFSETLETLLEKIGTRPAEFQVDDLRGATLPQRTSRFSAEAASDWQ